MRALRFGRIFSSGFLQGLACFFFVGWENSIDTHSVVFRYQGYDVDGRRLRLDYDVGLENKVWRTLALPQSNLCVALTSPLCLSLVGVVADLALVLVRHLVVALALARQRDGGALAHQNGDDLAHQSNGPETPRLLLVRLPEMQQEYLLLPLRRNSPRKCR